MEENHSDNESDQLLGDWDFLDSLLPPEKGTKGVSDKERGGSSSRPTVAGGRVLSPWAHPSYEKKIESDDSGLGLKDLNNKNKKKKESDDDSSGLSLKDLMDEYSSQPPQIAEWFWCIEYFAKFNKDLHCLLDLMNMGYTTPPNNDYGSRINEVVSLRILEFLFDPTKADPTTFMGPRIEFDLSLSNTHVLSEILEHIPLSELRQGMPQLSTFNVLPFIAHKNKSLPQCALEKLRDLSAMENQTSAAKANDDPVCRNEPSEHRDEMLVDEEQVHTGLEDEDNVVIHEDDPMQTNEGDEQLINKGNTTRETVSPSLDVPVKCTKDGAWLICGSSDDESDMVKGPGSVNANNIPPPEENECWKCKRGGGLLLICSRSECAAKVHKECLNCPANFDEYNNFHCPICWYDRMAMEYHESEKLMDGAKKRLMKFLPLLSRASKRLR